MTPLDIGRLAVASIVIGVSLMLGACSSRQLDATGRAWQRSVCRDYPPEQRARCEADANRTFAEDRGASAAGGKP